jgi:adenylylsulfate kinase
MTPESRNIRRHPSTVKREDRQALHKHKSAVLWFTGLSGSGKSTLAMELERELYERSLHCYVLDGDNVRYGLNRDLDFNPEDRKENIRRLGELARLFVDAGIIVLTAAISPYRSDRDMARSLFDKGDFIEIYVKCSIEECQRRDPKGLYKKAKEGHIKNFTGVSAPYEEPCEPDVVIETDRNTVKQSVQQLITYLEAKGIF